MTQHTNRDNNQGQERHQQGQQGQGQRTEQSSRPDQKIDNQSNDKDTRHATERDDHKKAALGEQRNPNQLYSKTNPQDKNASSSHRHDDSFNTTSKKPGVR